MIASELIPNVFHNFYRCKRINRFKHSRQILVISSTVCINIECCIGANCKAYAFYGKSAVLSD